MGKVNIFAGRGKMPLLKILQATEHSYQKKKNCILLVPEQYTLQGEQDLLNHLSLPGFFNIQVLSPSRLCYRIFEQTGKDKRTPIDTAGKHIAVAQAILKAEKDLAYYQSIVHSAGFGEKMIEEIDHWKEAGFTAESLTLKGQDTSLSPSLAAKIADICSIWLQYDKVMEDQFMDGIDVTADAIIRLAKQPMYKGYDLFVYGFDMLTHELRQLLAALAGQCNQVVISMVADKASAPDGHVFTPAWRSIRQLAALLREKSITWNITFLRGENADKTPKDILHLNNNLFAYPAKEYDKVPENLFLHIAPTIFDEVEQVANQLIDLHLKGTPWDQMAVLIGNFESYHSLIYGILTSYRIPFYMDVPISGSEHGLIRFLIHAVRAATKGYQTEDIMACIKSGYAPLTPLQCDQLENYMLAYGIKRRQWAKSFAKGKPDTVVLMEEARLALITPLEHFRLNLSAATDTFESLTAVMMLLEEIGAYQKLLKQEENLLALGLEDVISQNRQVWQLVLHTLDQMYNLMEGKRIPAVHIAAWLESAFLSSQIRSLPPTRNTLFCGELGHALLGNVSSLFVLGLNDGLLKRETSTLLTDQEQAKIEADANNPLFLTGNDLVHLAHADLIRSFSLPGKYLYLSYPQSNLQGQVLRPLPQIDRITNQLFPKLIVTGGALEESSAPPLAPSPALAKIGSLLKTGLADNKKVNSGSLLPNQWEEAFASLYANPRYQGQLREILLALSEKEQVLPLKPALAKALFGKEVLSVSRLETFAKCPYRHFVQYGLRPVDRLQWTVSPQDIGTFYHEALKNFTKEIASTPSWPNITKKQSHALMEKATSSLIQDLAKGPLGESTQTLAQAKRYQNTLETAAWVFTKQAAYSDFRPQQAEVSFGYENSLLPPIFLSLSSGENVMIRGIIDRIDQFQNGQSLYLRVVDYKSSDQSLDPTALWWGIQLQLILYLHAAVSYDEKLFPAGAFYFHVDDPFVQMDDDIVEKAEEEIAKTLKLKGISLADPEIYRAMDQQEKPSYVEKVFNKDGTLAQHAKALSLREMQSLLKRSLSLANDFANQIYQGNISLAPVELPDQPACMYCEYQGICGIEASNAHTFVKALDSITMDELKERLTP